MASPVLAVVGPTGSGKSSVAVHLAQELGGEIISCDAVQVYRNFDIGTAKPTLAQRGGVRHHLVDVVSWGMSFDAAAYVQHADAALAEVRQRGRYPIVCGGTGLYLRAFRRGLMPAPPAQPELRAHWQSVERERPGSLYAQLLRTDPQTAVCTEPNNLVHIIRALEIATVTGTPASALRRAHGFRQARIPMQIFVLSWPRDLLRARIKARTHAMLAAGLLSEVAGLLQAGVPPTCTPMRALGYREVCDVLAGRQPMSGLADRIIRNTWAYARRQRTWWRKEPNITWIDVTSEAAVARAVLSQAPP